MDGRNEANLRPGNCLHAEDGRWRSVQPVSDCARQNAVESCCVSIHGEVWCVVHSQTSNDSVVAASGLQQRAFASHSDTALQMAFARLDDGKEECRLAVRKRTAVVQVDSPSRDCETRENFRAEIAGLQSNRMVNEGWAAAGGSLARGLKRARHCAAQVNGGQGILGRPVHIFGRR